MFVLLLCSKSKCICDPLLGEVCSQRKNISALRRLQSNKQGWNQKGQVQGLGAGAVVVVCFFFFFSKIKADGVREAFE